MKGALKKPTEDGAKKEKKAIHWADENGGLLREVRTIEVAKIKRSTAHYSSTRELSKRERLAEKETHLSKAEDAMQKNTDWRTYALAFPSIFPHYFLFLFSFCLVQQTCAAFLVDRRA